MASSTNRIGRLAPWTAAAALCVALSACAPQQTAPVGGEAGEGGQGGTAVSAEWSPDADCAACHAREQESYEDSACLASLHADVACGQCHDDSSALATAHEGSSSSDKAPARLKVTEVSDAACLSCHYETKEALAEATPDVVVADSQGNGRNPHALDGVADHEGIGCSDCHGMHSSEPVQEQAKATCTNCHHAGVYECYTCHE